MRITFSFHIFNSLALFSQIRSSTAFPLLSRRVAVPVHSGASHITTITVIGTLILLLFLAKWVYVCRRRRKQRLRSRKLASMWRDDFSSSSLHLWRQGASNKGNPVKSALLVGLFGSPSWETRYSAIVGKVSGGEPQSLRQEFAATAGSVRSKGPSEKSDKKSPVLSPNSKANSRVNSMLMHHIDSTRPKSLSESTEILVPSSALGSTDYFSWKKNLLTGRHASYPTGLCIETGTGSCSFKNKTPATFLPSVPSGLLPVESLRQQLNTKEALKSPLSEVPVKDPPSSPELSWNLASSPKDLPCLSIEYALQDDSTQPQASPHLHAHPYSCPPAPPITLDIDQRQSKPVYSPCSGVPHVDPCDTCCMSPPTIPSAKLQSRIASPPPRDHGRTRARRSSPKVGPSPLRRMFLPSDDFNDEELEAPCTPVVEQDDDPDIQRRSYNDNGSIQLSPTVHIQTPRSTQRTRPSIGNLTMSDNLLDFLDELVQETSEWDASLFVDDNFKAMINHSKSSDSSPSSTTTNQIKRTALSRKQRISFTQLEGIPEVDVSDFSSTDSEVPLNHSYWSDEDESQREAVGIAH